MTVEQRIETIERSLRRWRRIAASLCVVLVVIGTAAACDGDDANNAGAVATSGQEGIPDVIKARRFEVVNEDGVPVVVAGATTNGIGVLSAGEVKVVKKGTIVVVLGTDAEGNGVLHSVNKDRKTNFRFPAK